jgi:hypothetical protein
MGVCTTKVAALQVGRMFIGIEIEEEYHGMGKERIYKIAVLVMRSPIHLGNPSNQGGLLLDLPFALNIINNP